MVKREEKEEIKDGTRRSCILCGVVLCRVVLYGVYFVVKTFKRRGRNGQGVEGIGKQGKK